MTEINSKQLNVRRDIIKSILELKLLYRTGTNGIENACEAIERILENLKETSESLENKNCKTMKVLEAKTCPNSRTKDVYISP